MYNIYSRIKDIDQNYELFWNNASRVFEIHDTSNKMCSLCLIVRANELDARVLYKLFVTRRQNMKKLFKEIEESNAKFEESKKRDALSECNGFFREIMDFASRKSNDLTANDIQKIIKINRGENNYA